MSKCFERIENLMGPGLEISLLTYHRLRYQLVNGSIMNSQAIRNLFQGRSQTYGVRVGYMDLPFHQRNNLQHELDFLSPIGDCTQWSQAESLGIWRRMARVFRLMNSAFNLL